MIKNIVIEGPNNVGKSTLILKLLDRKEFRGWRTEHVTEKSPNTLDFYDATLSNCEMMIFDRHCIGETIYPYLFNRTPKITENDVVDLIEAHGDTLFVILSASLDFINNAYASKGETPNWYFITEERQLFEDAAKTLVHKHANVYFHRNEFQFETTDDLVDFIIKLCTETEHVDN